MKFTSKIITGFLLGLVLFAVSLLDSKALAWGGRGHHTICSAATFLVKEEGLKEFLRSRPHVMGHLCNIPDIYWKSLGSDVSKLGNPAHFIDVEITGLKLKDVPTDYKQVVSQFTGKPNALNKDKTIFSVPTEFGSLWWRADQFMRRATGLETEWKAAALPANSKEEQDENLAFNKNTYSFILNLGLMGHFVGDASQPFHGTADYDGYAVGHGGIHSFFEETGVSVIGSDLEDRVVKAAKKLRGKAAYLKQKTTIEKMKGLSELALADVPLVIAADPVKKPSSTKSEKGMEIRIAAERADIKTVSKKFEPIIIQGMSRSAALLAQLWDEAYVSVGRPNLAAYKAYKYPLTPEFVAPDYFEEAPAPAKK